MTSRPYVSGSPRACIQPTCGPVRTSVTSIRLSSTLTSATSLSSGVVEPHRPDPVVAQRRRGADLRILADPVLELRLARGPAARPVDEFRRGGDLGGETSLVDDRAVVVVDPVGGEHGCEPIGSSTTVQVSLRLVVHRLPVRAGVGQQQRPHLGIGRRRSRSPVRRLSRWDAADAAAGRPPATPPPAAPRAATYRRKLQSLLPRKLTGVATTMAIGRRAPPCPRPAPRPAGQHDQVDAQRDGADGQEAGVLVVGPAVLDPERPQPVPERSCSSRRR